MVKRFKFFGFGCLFIAIIPQMAARTSRPISLVKHEFSYPHGLNIPHQLQPASRSIQYSAASVNPGARDVHFTNDLADIVELDLLEQNNWEELDDLGKECINHFRRRPVIIRAVKEYTTHHGDEVKVETRDSWELTFQELGNDKLLTLDTFRKLVNEHFMPKAHFESKVQKWWNQAKLFIYRKVMARYAKTTFIVCTNIDPAKESILCSDIFLDLDKLVADNKDKIEIDVDYGNLLHMRIYIKQIA